MPTVLYFSDELLIRLRMPAGDRLAERPAKPIYGGLFGYGEWAMVVIQYPYASLPELRYLVAHAHTAMPITDWCETKREALQAARRVLRLLPKSDLLTCIRQFGETVAALEAQIEAARTAEEPAPIVRTKRDSSGYVYLIRCDKRYKIGKAVDVEQRLRAMVLPSKPEIIATGHFDTPYKIERELHRQYRHCREHGEWFRLSPDEVKAVKERLGLAALAPKIESAQAKLRVA